MGTIAALAGPGEVVFSDELNHASIIDGCRLARAETVVYRHNDVEHLESLLRERAGTPGADRHRRGLLDGRRRRAAAGAAGAGAPLRGAADGRRGARDRGDRPGRPRRGRRRRALAARSTSSIGTLGKALGSYGAYVCASAETVDYLVNRARPFIFSTAPPPPVVGAARAALGVLEAEPERVERLTANARALREALAAEGLARGRLDHPDRADRDRRGGADDGRSASGRWSAASSPRGSGRRPCPRAPRACASR